MITTIKKGNRKPWPFIRLGLYINCRAVRRAVTFRKASYLLPNEDQLDQNKLFGIGYFPSHHTDSARIGWNWDPETGDVSLSCYCYIDGRRQIKPLARLKEGERAVCSIFIQKDFYLFQVLVEGVARGYEVIPKFHRKKFGFPLGIYFGGNQKAPNDIEVEIEKL